MTNEHEKLPSGKLAEAMAAYARYDYYEHSTEPSHMKLLLEAARKYAALEPLLRELCEAIQEHHLGDEDAFSDRRIISYLTGLSTKIRKEIGQ